MVFVGCSARMFERVICASSAAATKIMTEEGIRMFFMRTWLTGRHSFAYFSIAADRKVSSCRSTTDAFDFDFHLVFKSYWV